MGNTKRILRIGTRGSLLAVTQTEWVVERLRKELPEIDFSIEIIQTTGDQRRDVPFNEVGTKGMFVKEIEQALLAGTIDVGVHSLKDMPSELPEELELRCVPEREEPLDALISLSGLTLYELPEHSIIGTSSVRRRAQLHYHFPNFVIRELRGNLDTRIRKLDSGEYDAIILACAGLNRLGWRDRITERISPEISVPAAGQGALALETRIGDMESGELLASLHHADTALCITAERAFLKALGGGCSIPAGAYARIAGDQLHFLAMLANEDGSILVTSEMTGHLTDAENIGKQSAEELAAKL